MFILLQDKDKIIKFNYHKERLLDKLIIFNKFSIDQIQQGFLNNNTFKINSIKHNIIINN
jgi:hypothetical protein